MSIEATLATWKLNKKIVTSTEKLFLLSCANRAGENHECWPSISRLSSDTGLDRKTIINLRKSVIEKGLMEYSGEFKGRSGQIPVMRLTYVDELEQKLTSTDIGTGTSTDIGTGDQYQYWDTESKRENLKEETIYLTPVGENKKNDSGELIRPGEQETYYPMPKKNQSPESKRKLNVNDLKKNNPHKIPIETIEDWLTTRKEKKAAVTLTAWNRLNASLSKCAENGHSPIECFEIMVSHGWSSLQPEWITNVLRKPEALQENLDWGKDLDKDLF